MKKLVMYLAGLTWLATFGTARGTQELNSEESLAVIQRMMDSLPAGRWIEKGVLKIDHTRFLNDVQTPLVERITNYVEPQRVLQEFEVVSGTANMDLSSGNIPPEVKKALESAKKAGILSPSPTKRVILTEEGKLLTHTIAPSHSARIDESGRFPYHRYNPFLSAGLFQKQGFLSKENLRVATVSGKKEASSFLEIAVTRADFTAVIALDPGTVRPLACKIDETNGNSQLWEYEWAGDGKSIPAQVTITKNSKGFSQTDSFRYQLVSETTKPEDFQVEFPYGTTVEYLPPSNAGQLGSVVYVHNPFIDVQSLIARRFQFVLSPQERKNCATAALNAVEERFGVAFGDTSAIVHPGDPNQAGGKGPLTLTSAVEIRDLARSKGLYSEIVRTDIDHLAALGNDTMAILHLPNRKHFTIFVGVYGKDVWVSQSDTPKCLYILNRGDLDAWKGTTILICAKPIPLAGSAG